MNTNVRVAGGSGRCVRAGNVRARNVSLTLVRVAFVGDSRGGTAGLI